MDMLKIEAAAKVLAELTPEQREFALYLAARENSAPKRRGRPPGRTIKVDPNSPVSVAGTDYASLNRQFVHPADVAERERGQ